ncbi:MAG TPA: hypothetical protein VNV15_03535 [Opitutaceae bacterium]|nr:hypothetical protein [Opitutaceae bacterium]
MPSPICGKKCPPYQIVETTDASVIVVSLVMSGNRWTFAVARNDPVKLIAMRQDQGGGGNGF